MFPSKKSSSGIALKTSTVDKAPWFEIFLFQTKLRFRNPKSTAKPTQDLNGDPIDLRPFVNTASKQGYSRDLSYAYGRDVYANAWRFCNGGFFARTAAVLHLQLVALSVTDNDIPRFTDLFEPETGSRWVNYYYQSRHAMFDEVSFVRQENDDIEIVFEGNPTGTLAAAQPSLTINILDLNGHIAYQVSPTRDQLVFFVPFTKTDSLQFIFQLRPQQKIEAEDKKHLLDEASALANSIMASIEMTYPNK